MLRYHVQSVQQSVLFHKMFDFNHKMRYSVFNKYLYSKSDARALLPEKAARSNHGEHFAHISQLELKFHKRVIAELFLIISYCKNRRL